MKDKAKEQQHVAESKVTSHPPSTEHKAPQEMTSPPPPPVNKVVELIITAYRTRASDTRSNHDTNRDKFDLKLQQLWALFKSSSVDGVKSPKDSAPKKHAPSNMPHIRSDEWRPPPPPPVPRRKAPKKRAASNLPRMVSKHKSSPAAKRYARFKAELLSDKMTDKRFRQLHSVIIGEMVQKLKEFQGEMGISACLFLKEGDTKKSGSENFNVISNTTVETLRGRGASFFREYNATGRTPLVIFHNQASAGMYNARVGPSNTAIEKLEQYLVASNKDNTTVNESIIEHVSHKVKGLRRSLEHTKSHGKHSMVSTFREYLQLENLLIKHYQEKDARAQMGKQT